MKSDRCPRILFWVFCFVVFSKVVWYDLRVYVPQENRRDYLTACFALWIGAQVLVYLPVVGAMLRRIDRTALFWAVAVAPYLLLGLMEGRINTFLLGDLARYALPLGYLLFGAWALETVAVRAILRAATGALATCIGVRTVLHWAVSEGTIRYGMHWEVLLPCLLVAFALVAKGWRYGALLLALAALAFVAAMGQTRAVLLGTAIAGALIGLYALARFRSQPSRSLRLGLAAGLAIALAVAPTVLPSVSFQRLNIANVARDTDTELLTEMSQEARRGGPDEGEEVADAPPTDGFWRRPSEPARTAPNEQTARLDAARRGWEKAIRTGGRSLDVRITEGYYFLTLMRSDARSLLLGAGAGAYVTVETREHTRKVRGAHNTYVTLLYRHGIVLGTLLALFVTLYGLPTNIRQLVEAPSRDWRMLLVTLIAYRFAAIGMAQFHQGLFDDPMVFFAMAVARTPAFEAAARESPPSQA